VERDNFYHGGSKTHNIIQTVHEGNYTTTQVSDRVRVIRKKKGTTEKRRQINKNNKEEG